MGNALLSIIYFVVVAPVGLVGRLIHDPLSRRRKQRAATYWRAPVREAK
jgi:hypothetical protein